MHASRIGSLLVILAVMGLGGIAWGANTAVVTSLTVAPNQSDVSIPIMLVNDVEIRASVFPLMIRTVSGGAYVTAVKLDLSDRVGTFLTEITYLNHYNQGLSDTAWCKTFHGDLPKSPGGFVGVPDYNGTEKQTVTGVPYGLMFANQRIFGPNMPSGSDVTGSYIIAADVGDQEGIFEIDTTCVDPFNHIAYNTQAHQVLVPEFTKGVITVGTPGDHNPPVAVDDHMGARDGVRLYVVGAGVLTNDSDPDGDPLTAVLNTGASHGALDLHTDGSFFYTPDAGYDGIDQFSYYADDGALQSPAPATVTLYVKGGGAVPPGDYDEDGDLTATDLAQLIEALFVGGLDPTDGGCRDWPRGDIDCDGYSTGVDLGLLIDHLFAGGDSPCDPCGL